MAAPVGSALSALTTSAGARDWPTRPVTVIAPLAAGGSTDPMARPGTERFAARFRWPRLRPRSNLEEGASAQIVSAQTQRGGTGLLFVAVDIGGTFTDLVGFDDAAGRLYSAKRLTTPDNLVRGVLNCIDRSGLALGDVTQLIHGSTVAINTLIERKGAPTALLVTKGTRDVYAIGRGNRPEAYNLFFARPKPLVSRRSIHEVDERMLAGGIVRTNVDPAQVARIAATLRDSGCEAVAVCFLHSYANTSHEQCGGRRASARTARRVCLPVARDHARIPRIRAHLDDGGECLHRSQGERLCRQPGGGAAGARLSWRTLDHAVERWRDVAAGRGQTTRDDDGIRPGRRHHSQRGSRPQPRACKRDLLRHGGHHRQGEPGAGLHAGHGRGLLRRRLSKVATR